MKTVNQKVLESYIPYVTTLREVARIVGISNHKVKRILDAEGVQVVKGKLKPFTDDHRRKISSACKGRDSWSKGKRMPKNSLYKNMSSHLRFNVSAEWLSQFENVEKLKFLNSCVTDRSGRFDVSDDWYKSYIIRFYSDKQFNRLYEKWLETEDKYLRPTIDHIEPRSKGGGNELSNLQFLSWFENKAKNDMSQEEWDNIKANIKDYLI